MKTRSFLAMRIRIARRALLQAQVERLPLIAVMLASEGLRLAIEEYHLITSIDPITQSANAYASAKES